jgi:hypothetical protein
LTALPPPVVKNVEYQLNGVTQNQQYAYLLTHLWWRGEYDFCVVDVVGSVVLCVVDLREFLTIRKS